MPFPDITWIFIWAARSIVFLLVLSVALLVGFAPSWEMFAIAALAGIGAGKIIKLFT